MTLSQNASVVEAIHGRVPLGSLLNTRCFDFAKASQAPGWLKVLNGEELSQSGGGGIGSFIYRARRPFHPGRFMSFLTDDQAGVWKSVLRSKGHFWLATRMGFAGLWQQAGGSGVHTCCGFWWAAVEKAMWPRDRAGRAAIRSSWEEPFGDRRQELVFIGRKMNHGKIQRLLDRCLLTSREMSMGESFWSRLDDPFPAWESNHVHSHS